MIPLLARTPLRHEPPTPWPSGGGNRALSPKGPRRLFPLHVQAKTSAQVGEVAAVVPPEAWRDDGRTPAPHWSQAQLFTACDPSFGKPLADFLAYMKTAYGADIRIIDSWRPWFTQADKLRRGVSKVDTSYHNHVTPDLRPAALGADLLLVYPEGKTTLSRKDYQEGVGKAMRASALQFGLAMGWFGLGNPARTVENAYALPMGWDPFHIQLFTPPYSITALRKLLTERYTAQGVPPAVSPASPLVAPLAAPLTAPSPSQEAPEEEAPEEAPASGRGGLLLVGLGALVLGAWGLSRRAA